MEEKNKTVTWVIIAGVVILALLGFWLYQVQKPEEEIPLFVSNFEECAQAGFSILESSPRQCKTPEGTTYTEKITIPENVEENPVTDFDTNQLSK